MKELLDLTHDIVFKLNQKGEFILVNNVITDVLGYSKGEILRKNAIELVHPEDMDIINSMENRVRKSNTVKDISIRYRAKSGKFKTLQTNLMAVFDNDMITGYIGAARDIIGQNQLEKLIRESAELYSHLYENNKSIMLLIDPDTADIVNANRTACDFYGYSKKEMTSKKITEINMLPEEEVFVEMDLATGASRMIDFSQDELPEIMSSNETIPTPK